MTSIDDKIKQALNEELSDAFDENNKLNSSIMEQFTAGFKGRMKTGYRVVYIFITMFYSFVALSAYKFYFAADTKTQIGFAACGIFFSIAAMLGELYYFSEMGRNRVIREVKLVELQLAQVLKNQEKE